MRLLTLNLRHGGGTRTAALADAIASHAPDVAVLSEFLVGRSGRAILDALAALGWTLAAHSEPQARANGVLIASRLRFEPMPPPATKPEWRRHWVEARFENFALVGVYFPLGRPKLPYWEWFMGPAAERAEGRTVLLGDFNTGKHRLDEAGATFFGPQYIDRLEALGYVDAWRHRHPTAREYTWFSAKGNGFRVDHAFVSGPLASRIVAAGHSHAERENGTTDHSALIVDLEL